MGYDDLLQQLPDYDVPDDVIKEFEKFKGSALRKKAEQADAAESRTAELEAEIAALKAGPARDTALKDYGIDLEALSLLEREALDKVEIPEGGLTAEAIGALAEKYSLPMLEAAGEAGAGKPAAEKVVQHARGNPGKAGTTTTTPKEATEWSYEKLTRALREHPEEYEALLRGETVTGIVFA